MPTGLNCYFIVYSEILYPYSMYLANNGIIIQVCLASGNINYRKKITNQDF